MRNHNQQSRRTRHLAVAAVIFATALASLGQAPEQSKKNIDVQRSTLTIRVYKTGLFSAFAHDHEIRAPIQSGSFDTTKKSVELKVDSRTLRVVDPDVSDSDRTQIQSTMLGQKVLDSDRFPDIKFQSTRVESAGEGKWNVTGDLQLHGETHSVVIAVKSADGHFTGTATLRQKDFGITPVSIAGGSVKVKDELRVEFDVVGTP